MVVLVIPTTLRVYRSAIHPQGMKFRYGLGGRLISNRKHMISSNILKSYKSRLKMGVVLDEYAHNLTLAKWIFESEPKQKRHFQKIATSCFNPQVYLQNSREPDDNF